MKIKVRSNLGEHRPDYTFACGVCGRVIRGKSNTIHLGIRSHIVAEYQKGLRAESYASPQKYGDKGKKFV